MAKVVAHTPSWLSHPSPGAQIFSDPDPALPASPRKQSSALVSQSSSSGKAKARKTIATRGSEVFVVTGNKIRWADLATVKEAWEASTYKKKGEGAADTKVYRTLKTSVVYYQITALSVSPSGQFLAISTDHTVHIAVLPDASRLRDGDKSEIKLKTYQLGPTTHVIPEAPLAGVLWHPLAASSKFADCLLTVTTDAAVRLWEFELTNHWSFETPTLAIDLRKLADGTSSDQDFKPSGFGKSRGFSADTFDMEATAATWGGSASESEDPWAAMTLWTAMTNGDVYALCPLLPSKWRPTPTTIPALATATVSRMATFPREDRDSDERVAAEQCYQWVQKLDDEDLAVVDRNDESVRKRPDNPSAVPRLQGPFELPDVESRDEAEITDILVIPANLDEDELFSGEDDYEVLGGARSLPFTVVLLTTSENELHVMLELDGVTGQWLPKMGRNHFSVPTSEIGEFVLLETLSISPESTDGSSSPAFSIDSADPYSFFVTTASSIQSFSLVDWAARVSCEVTDDEFEGVDEGLEPRLRLACQGPICIQMELIGSQQTNSAGGSLSVATLVQGNSTGSLILSSAGDRAIAAQLDQPSFRTSRALANDPAPLTSIQSPFRASQALLQVLQAEPSQSIAPQPTRAPYAPSKSLYQNHMVRLDQLKSTVPIHRRAVLTDKPMRLSPACLEVITLAHRNFSHQTSEVEMAATELFRRCERLREELVDQLKQMTDLAERFNSLKGEHNSEEREQIPPKSHSEALDARIEAAKARQKELFSRYERVRQKASKVGRAKKELSIKERAWSDELESMAKHLGLDSEHDDTISSRIASAKDLSKELVSEFRSIRPVAESGGSGTQTPEGKVRVRLGAGGGGMSSHRRGKVQEVMGMIEREAAIIEAVHGRLGRLSVNV